MYGQFCMIHKETDTVLAMTAVTGDMQGEMNVYYEEVLLHYPNQPLADFFDLTLSCENDIITLTDKEGEIRYLAGRAEWKKTCRKVHCTPLYTKKNQVDTPVIGAWCMKDGSLVIKVYEIEMLEEDTLTLTPEVDGTQVKLVNTTIPSQPNEYHSRQKSGNLFFVFPSLENYIFRLKKHRKTANMAKSNQMRNYSGIQLSVQR